MQKNDVGHTDPVEHFGVSSRMPLLKPSKTGIIIDQSAFFTELAQRLLFETITEADDGVVGPVVRKNSAGV